jgi:TolA-binding protein
MMRALPAIAAVILVSSLPAQQPTDTSAKPPAPVAVPVTRGATTTTPTAPVTMIVQPAPDQARGLDAELRMALFDITMDHPLSALDRLEWLRSSAVSGSGAIVTGMRAQEDLLFLLTESYYRLGMRESFRKAATSLDSAAPGGRYAGVIAAQRMLDAYSRGDYARVRTLASGQSTGDRGLISLVAGLAAVQSRDFTAAHAAFAQAQAAGGQFSPYAQYMDALATVAGDSAKGADALSRLQALSEGNNGVFAEQVRLSAAQTALGVGQYAAAASLADGVPATSGAGAQALLTKAWALYRGGNASGAAAAFREFATRYPYLPARDEARLMAGQILLESGKSDSAEKYFQGVADSISGELAALQARAATAMTEASRALVTARVAGSVFIANAAPGKVISLPDDAGAEKTRIAGVFAGTSDSASGAAPPQILYNLGIAERVDSAGGAGFPTRVVFAPRVDAQTPGAYADRTQAVLATDIRLALASYRLQEQIDAQKTKIAALENLQRLIVEGDSGLAVNAKQIEQTQDSLEQMKGVLLSTREKVRNTLRLQISATRKVAAENIRLLDSTKASLGANAKGPEIDALSMEQRTAGVYSAIADDIERGLEAALDHHPAFVLRDSLVARIVRAHAMHDSTAVVLSDDSLLVANELATQRGKESNAVLAMRTEVAGATTQRAAAEGALVALVDEELRARATGLVAQLSHDREAADYATASAAFFKAMDASATAPGGATAAGTSTAPGGASTPPRQ